VSKPISLLKTSLATKKFASYAASSIHPLRAHHLPNVANVSAGKTTESLQPAQ
jgi:hypothetical protein